MITHDQIKLYAFDLDGTVYVGDELIPGAKETLEALNERAAVCYLTNNSSKTKAEYLDKLHRLGLQAEEGNVITSLDATIAYVDTHLKGRSVYLVGTDSVVREAQERGLSLDERQPDAVIVTLDTTLTYEKLCTLCRSLRQGALYLATHPDKKGPAPGGFVPDVGSFLALVEAVTGRSPDVVCGKPFRPTAELLERRFGCSGREIMMVGDRLSTDIRLGIDNGYRTCAVLTGETTRDMLRDSAIRPELVLDSLADLV